MVCVLCGGQTQVVNSRHQKRLNRVWRRRHCLACRTAFTTQETADYGAVWAIRSQTGALRPFSRDMLFLSLYKSCQHRQTALGDAEGLTDTVIIKLSSMVKDGVIDSRTVALTAQVALNRFDKAASTHYQAFHRLES